MIIVTIFVLIALGTLILSTGIGDTISGAASPGPNTTAAAGPTGQPTQQQQTQQPTQPTSEQPTQATPEPPKPTKTPTPKQGEYQNDDYQAGPPPANPPRLPRPTTDAEAKSWLVKNPLYSQSTPEPIRCDWIEINPKTASRDQLERSLNDMMGCLMKEWDGVLAAAGFVAVRPKVTIYTGPIETECGRVDGNAAFYCAGDQGIYYPTTFFQYASASIASTKLALIRLMGHEFGHAIQGRTGIIWAEHILSRELPKNQAFEYSRRTELQADCFTGRFVRSLAKSLNLSDKDRAILKELVVAGADDNQKGDPDHGLSATRVYWLTTGIDTPGTLSVCNTWSAPSDKVR